MDLSIIIVNWNSKAYLRKCLASVFGTTCGLTFEVIVIDSASFDGCAEMLRSEFPQVGFLQSQENLGFAKSNNVAFQAVRGEYVLFLNPDTEILGTAISVLLSALKNLPQAGAVGAKLLNSDGTLQTSCIQAFPTVWNQLLGAELLRRWFPRSRLWGMAPLFEAGTEPRVVDAISGACVMLPRQLLCKVGVFSEDYFMYAEDIDLSYKVAKAGFRCYYVPTATVVHHGGGSSQGAGSAKSSILMRESAWRFFRKIRGRYYGAAYRLSTLVAALVRLAVLILVFPFGVIGRRGGPWRTAFTKWKGILLWSVQPPGWGNY